MSGHSKWATTKRQKEATDSKRSVLFTKLSKIISVAARDGSDLDTNFKLRMAVDKARSYSMPKDNIERAIARGGGAAGGAQLESSVYECFGTGGVAIMVEVVTDNKNRAVSDLKHALSRFGGNLAGSGSVAWMFTPRGTITLKEQAITDEQELSLIDAGLIETETSTNGITLIVELDKQQQASALATKLGLTVTEAAPALVAKEKIKPANEESVVHLLEALDELDDVNAVYTNADV